MVFTSQDVSLLNYSGYYFRGTKVYFAIYVQDKVN